MVVTAIKLTNISKTIVISEQSRGVMQVSCRAGNVYARDVDQLIKEIGAAVYHEMVAAGRMPQEFK